MNTITTLPTATRPEAMQALSQDIQQRALQQQMLAALRDAERTLVVRLGELADHHPTLRNVRAAITAAEVVRS